MAGFGSPAIAVQDEGLIGTMPSPTPFTTFLQAVASQAQASHGVAHAVIHSPWAPVTQHATLEAPFQQQQQISAPMTQPEANFDTSLQFARCLSANTSLLDQPGPRGNLPSESDSLRQASCSTTVHETKCSLCHRDGPFGVGAAFDPLRGSASVACAEVGLKSAGSLNPSASHVSVGGISGNESDSDMEDSIGSGVGCLIPESDDDEEYCMQQKPAHGRNIHLEKLAADLDNRFEALSMFSPDNQIPLLSHSLGRRVSVHGAHAEMAEPWGRAAVFGCNTTSSGTLSIAASLAGEFAATHDVQCQFTRGTHWQFSWCRICTLPWAWNCNAQAGTQRGPSGCWGCGSARHA